MTRDLAYRLFDKKNIKWAKEDYSESIDTEIESRLWFNILEAKRAVNFRNNRTKDECWIIITYDLEEELERIKNELINTLNANTNC